MGLLMHFIVLKKHALFYTHWPMEPYSSVCRYLKLGYKINVFWTRGFKHIILLYMH